MSLPAIFRRGSKGFESTIPDHSTASDEEQATLLLLTSTAASEPALSPETSPLGALLEPKTPAFLAAMREEAMAVVASLEGVLYEIRFVLRSRGKTQDLLGDNEVVSVLTLEALARWADVQPLVDKEFATAAERGPLHLTFGGEVLPLEAPVALTGVGDRDTVIVYQGDPNETSVDEGELSEIRSEDSLDDAMQRLASV
jgi:hypothetical protein